MNKQCLVLLRARCQSAWQGLAVRERRAVTLAALVLSGCLVCLTLIQRRRKTIAYWQIETPKLRSQSEALEALLRDAGGPSQGQPLEVALRQTLEANGLGEHYRLQLTGTETHPQTWQLTFDDAPADGVMGWLLSNPGAFSLEVIEARLQRTAPANPDDTDTRLP